MRCLSQKIILILFLTVSSLAQSPHGEKFNYDCELCHQSSSWKIDVKNVKFDHSTTTFELVGQHKATDCRSCHTNLEFSKINSDCISCHTDLHQGTVGKDCSKCHSSKTWMVEDMNGLHQKGRFPLLGNHLTADCQQCHTRFIDLYFEPLNTDCFACHDDDYKSTQNPNHVAAEFSTQCEDCHDLTASSWSSVNIAHDFFPLVGGHTISNCFACHETGGNFAGLSPECFACHDDDYNNPANDPNHIAANFPTDCQLCHTINGWSPSSFDHALTAFPLTGQHITVQCQNCHTSGYSGTPTNCFSCHQEDYNATQDPNHVLKNYSTTCTDCHTTNGWDEIINFNHNITQFPLTGAHITTDCSSCHQQGFTNTPIDCFLCHTSDYNNSTNPNHIAAGFPTTCVDCHTTAAWAPSTFDHDGQYFPIYTGEHAGEWNLCADCHEIANNFAVFTCTSCHEHNQQDMDDKHQSVQGYVYESNACLSCHPDGTKGNAFNHSNSIFPLTGAHTTLDCIQCHQSGYSGTPAQCLACHQNQYNNSANPSHTVLSLPTECEQCHTTNPDWQPATFPIHNQFFELLGAHANVPNCSDCHNGNYSNTSNTCIGCHQEEYNIAPEHAAQGFPTNCEMCHNSIAWNQVTFDHNTTNFQLTGAHINVNCSDCHESGFTGTTTICYDCHTTDYQQSSNPNHTVLSLPTDCVQCHTTNPDWQPATFPIHNQFFELLGAHSSITNCNDCHNGNYNNTPNTCIGCHQNEFNGTVNPPHQLLNFSTDCLQCHNMNGWIPASFNHSFFPISSDHNSVDCSECHSEPNYQPQCLSCHLEDFLDEHDQGDPTNCWDCHSTFDWNDNSPGLKQMRRVE